MYLLYIDDSGTCDLKKDSRREPTGGNSRYFTLGAILIKAHELNRIESEMDKFKVKCIKGTFPEIKYSINNLNCTSSCFKNSPDKLCYRKNISVILDSIDCHLFASVQDKYFTTSKKIVNDKLDVYKLSFEHLLKSVDLFMYNNNIKEDAIVFIDKKDNGPEKDNLIYNAYKRALQNKKIYKAFTNTIFSPTINIVYSQYTLGAQLADFVAGSIGSFYENLGSSKSEQIKINNKIFKDKFYCDKNRKYLRFNFLYK